MSFVVYGLMGLMPGDPIDLMVTSNPNLTPADLARLKALYGLDRPLLARYAAWLGAALQGDFGYSRLHLVPVLDVLGPRLANTLVLMGASLACAFAIALPAGVFAAAKPRSRRAGMINLAAFAGISMPPFWLAILLIILFAVKLRILPASGMATSGATGLGDRLYYLVLPVMTLTLATVGGAASLCAGVDDRGVAAGLHPHRPGQGRRRAAAALRPCAAQRDDPHRHHPGAGFRHAVLRRADHRDDVRLSGHGQDDLRRHSRQRLQPGHGRAAAGDDDGAAGEPGGRYRLCRARSRGSACDEPAAAFNGRACRVGGEGGRPALPSQPVAAPAGAAADGRQRRRPRAAGAADPLRTAGRPAAGHRFHRRRSAQPLRAALAGASSWAPTRPGAICCCACWRAAGSRWRSASPSPSAPPPSAR